MSGTTTNRRQRRCLLALPAAVLVLAVLASSCILEGSWILVPPVAPEDYDPLDRQVFSDVSCVAPTFCMAVGQSDAYGHDPAVTDPPSMFTWDGSSWTALAVGPTPPGAENMGNPNFVSCGTPTRCAVVHDYLTPDRQRVLTYSVWDGASWTQVPLLLSDVIDAQVFACAPDGSCVFTDAVHGTVTYDGSGFESFPSSPIRTPVLESLTCFSRTSCNGMDGAQLWTWDGTGWTDGPGPVLPPSSRDRRSFWNDFTCTSPRNCLAVGTTYDSSGPQWSFTPLAARFDGTSWTSTPLPDAGAMLDDVSCAGPGACLAMSGRYAVAWIGNQWVRVDAAPTMVNRALSCAGHQCMIVGEPEASGSVDGPPMAAVYTWPAS